MADPFMSADAGAASIARDEAEGRLTPRHIATAALCLLCLMLDGFDVQSMGYVAPAVVAEWRLDRAMLTPVFSAGLLGMLVGSFALSLFADRVGRRPVLIGCTIFFASCMLVMTFASSVPQLVAIRFIAGLGMGGIMPNALALVSQHSPARLRITIMMIVACGFTLGAALGGFAAVALIAWSGWRAVFVVGGIAPILLALAMIVWLPRASLSSDVGNKGVADESESGGKAGSTIAGLFECTRRRGTAVLWGLNFCNLVGLYFLSSWLPTLLAGDRFSTSVGILVGTAVQVGGVLGTLAMGILIDRLGFMRVLVPVFAIAAFSLWGIGQATSEWSLYCIAFCAGFCIVGGQPALNSMAAAFYPLEMRSTGIGWSLGFGRIGSVLGPVAGGALVAAKFDNAAIFGVLALPALLCVGLMLLMLTRPIPGHGAR